ncbi:putative uncharacterized protein C7orf78 [Tubulanus polymorphus]|uniref:putative uncharacterized protein C7orf78 n=1 Tax=Tubulanus polymorphus TaxID=672921 RepID=UPI003DA2A490
MDSEDGDRDATFENGGETCVVSKGDNGQRKKRNSNTSCSLDDTELTTINPFGFSSQTAYNAKENLLKCRSDTYLIRHEPPDVDIWSRKPPDFRPQSFAPKPPPRNSREAMKPWRYTNASDGYYNWRLSEKRDGLVLPSLLRPSWQDPRPKFRTKFDFPDPHEARVDAVKTKTFKQGPYTNPKPHDHRGLPPISQLGLDEFLTDYERDPFNIKFESQRLHTIIGPPPQIVPRQVLPGRFVEPVDKLEKWSRHLILDKDRYPDRPGSYTRFRRQRPARSAFLNRVEERLTSDWAREQMEQALLNHHHQHHHQQLYVPT